MILSTVSTLEFLTHREHDMIGPMDDRHFPCDAPDRPARLRRSYPSDLNDRQWERVGPLVSKAKRIGRPRRHDAKDVLDAINYRWQTGCPWRMLPHDFPPWATVYSHFRRWHRQGVIRQIRESLWRPSHGDSPARLIDDRGTMNAMPPAGADQASSFHSGSSAR